MKLTWVKNGCACRLEGMRNTKTGALRPLTSEELARFKREFKGPDFPKPVPDDFFKVIDGS